MFNEMRRKDRELTKQEALEILKKGEYGILTTIGTNGYPYGVPISYVYKNEKIYFHCAANIGTKVENIQANPKVSFTVIGPTEVLPKSFSTKYESVIAFGQAKELKDEGKKEALIYIIEKYSSEHKEAGLKYIDNMFEKTGIYEVSIDYISGKARR